MHNWYTNADGSPKTHRRPRSCTECRDLPKGGCSLPFRSARRVRWIAAQEKKPHFFMGLWFSRFMRSNVELTGLAPEKGK